jgi:phosphoribosyl 1,2-cyclic phosphodiesterase
MQFASLGSGSAGNSFLVKQNKSILMIDCGFVIQDIVSRLDQLNESPVNITAILLTHEHEDHVKGAFKLANKFKIPIWLSYGTFKMCEKYIFESYAIDLNVIDSHTAFEIENFIIQPFPVPHDAREPTQFTLSDGNHKLGILTDTGSSTPHIEKMLQQLDAVIIEFNHDLNLLESSEYTHSLKKRIRGKLGHLDNQTAAEILGKIQSKQLKHLVAAHLSEKNNTKDLVKEAIVGKIGCERDWIKFATQMDVMPWQII